MRIFVAGASGAIGLPLIAELVRRGHTVTGMTSSEAGAKKIIEQGAAAELANAFEPSSVERALRRADPEIVIDQLTALPKDPADMHRYLPGDTKLKLEGGGNLHRVALAYGVRRYLQQSSGFFLKPGKGLADESESMAIERKSRRGDICENVCRVRSANVEFGTDGRCTTALWIFLWA